MRYPIAIELGDKCHAFGVVVPDLPARVLRRIDQAAKAAGESRSGFIAHMALRR